MKILILSLEGDGFSLAMALKNSGDEVKIFTNFHGNKDLHLPMIGLIDKDTDLDGSLKWADLVIGDMVGLGFMEKKLLKMKGLPFLAISAVMDALELDRGKQMITMKRLNVKMPPTFEFSDPGDAESILQHWSSPGYVIKPSGNLNTAKTIMAEDPETYKWALSQFSRDQELVVQKIVLGVEVSTEGWFNGTEFVHFNHTFEEKKFLNGGLGQHVGCMGNIVMEGRADSILSKELQKLTPFLTKAHYYGPIDINMIVNENGPHALELTPRIGYDAIEALWAMSNRNQFSTFLKAVALGEKADLELEHRFGAAVRLTLPPYPMDDPDEDDTGLPIMAEENKEILWSDAYIEEGQLRWSAFDGVLAKVVGAGDDVVAAQFAAYENAHKVMALNLQYRTDIGDRVLNDLATLSAFGVNL